MEVKHRSRLRPEIDNRAPLQDLQNDDLILDQGRQGRRLAGFVAKLRQVLAGYGKDVKTLPQAFAENEQLDSRGVAHRRGLLMHEAVHQESLKVAINGRLRGCEFAREF